jgi:hypothetical protein
MSWRRLGPLSLDTTAAAGWAVSHAALPVTEQVDPAAWNVYLSLRDDQSRARIGRTRLTLTPTPQLAPLEAEPVLDLGPLGAFDDSGVVTSCLVTDGDRRLLYYTGWSRGITVPFYLIAGVAVSEKGGPFARLSYGPLLDRNAVDPFLTLSPFVLRDGSRWRMWYVSGSQWTMMETGPRHYYHIRYAESGDALTWRREGVVCVDYAPGSGEYAFGRPFVTKAGDRYEMWYSVRGDRYVIGYADSTDGVRWHRQDAVGGLLPAADGWDSEMTEYPYILEHHGRRYMLYNGNGYGKTGVGLAVWEPR